MKTLLVILAFMTVTTSVFAQTKNKMNTNKTLVVYFSCTGNTKNAAESLSKLLNADLFEIQPVNPYTSADLNWNNKESRSSVEMKDPSSRPEIATKVQNIEQYERIFIGFPVWWYVAPTIINTFIESYDFKNITVIPFATSGGSGIEKCETALQKSYPKIKWAKGKLLNSSINEKTLSGWIK